MTGQAHENRLDSGNNREARPTSRVTSAGIVTVSLIMLVIGSLLFLLLSPDLPISLLTIPMLLLGFGWGLPRPRRR